MELKVEELAMHVSLIACTSLQVGLPLILAIALGKVMVSGLLKTMVKNNVRVM